MLIMELKYAENQNLSDYTFEQNFVIWWVLGFKYIENSQNTSKIYGFKLEVLMLYK